MELLVALAQAARAGAIAIAFSTSPSKWGGGVNGVFLVGLYTQAWALCVFPLAFGHGCRWLARGEGLASAVGEGSVFWFTAQLQVGPGTPRTLLPDPDLRGRRALVVDDNQHAAAVLADLLKGMSFEVSVAHSGAEALVSLSEAARENRPVEVLVLDWQMPGMDGLEVARSLPGLKLPLLPWSVMVTGFGRDELLESARTLGVGEVLVKPVNASQMFDALMRLMGQPHAQPEPELAPGSSPFEALGPLRGARLLVVEDNELNQQVAAELLSDAGFVVELAGNGQEALAKLRQQPVDLVLMDMQMPVMDGLEATRAIRAQPGLRHLPVIAMTANAMAADRELCLAAGMNDHLAKPVNPDDLWRVLARWLKPTGRQPDLRPAGQQMGEAPGYGYHEGEIQGGEQQQAAIDEQPAQTVIHQPTARQGRQTDADGRRRTQCRLGRIHRRHPPARHQRDGHHGRHDRRGRGDERLRQLARGLFGQRHRREHRRLCRDAPERHHGDQQCPDRGHQPDHHGR